MEFNLDRSIEILERTPAVLDTLLAGLSDPWTTNNEGPGTWSPYDVVGHLIHGEKTDWIPRMEIILAAAADKRFTPFDRFAQEQESQGKSLRQLLDEFRALRAYNVGQLRAKNPGHHDLLKTGTHPEFGDVTLKQLLATWVAHDLGHLAQVSRVMARQYTDAVGPWKKYLPVLTR